jgi:hypothetical protein
MMSTKTIVEVDFWENQTYKPLNSTWSASYYGVNQYSDITGKINFKFEKVRAGAVYLPVGWEWSDREWVVDKSGTYGQTDEDGWSYAQTFEGLVEQSRLHALKSDRNNAIMRRRRWIRNRRVVIPDVVKLHIDRVDWIESLR